MRRPENHTQYTVEVSATAWKQMEHLPLETYQRIRRELESVAARLRPDTRPRSVEIRSLTIEGHTAIYEVDPERRRVTLREIASRSR